MLAKNPGRLFLNCKSGLQINDRRRKKQQQQQQSLVISNQSVVYYPYCCCCTKTGEEGNGIFLQSDDAKRINAKLYRQPLTVSVDLCTRLLNICISPAHLRVALRRGALCEAPLEREREKRPQGIDVLAARARFKTVAAMPHSEKARAFCSLFACARHSRGLSMKAAKNEGNGERKTHSISTRIHQFLFAAFLAIKTR